jgi:hypothetical protein
MEDELDGLNDMELWLKWVDSPEGKAREKINEALTDLRLDPEITALPICADFLDLMLRISPADPGAETLFDLVKPITAYFNKLQAQSGAAAKLAIDPKQVEKALVRECWDDWQKKSDRYTGKAAFARDMLPKLEHLKSQPVIERWCREWEKVAITQPAK